MHVTKATDRVVSAVQALSSVLALIGGRTGDRRMGAFQGPVATDEDRQSQDRGRRTRPEISYKNFRVTGIDPHGFDADNDGIGCEKN
jgi:hypothetical protein